MLCMCNVFTRERLKCQCPKTMPIKVGYLDDRGEHKTAPPDRFWTDLGSPPGEPRGSTECSRHRSVPPGNRNRPLEPGKKCCSFGPASLGGPPRHEEGKGGSRLRLRQGPGWHEPSRAKDAKRNQTIPWRRRLSDDSNSKKAPPGFRHHSSESKRTICPPQRQRPVLRPFR